MLSYLLTLCKDEYPDFLVPQILRTSILAHSKTGPIMASFDPTYTLPSVVMSHHVTPS